MGHFLGVTLLSTNKRNASLLLESFQRGLKLLFQAFCWVVCLLLPFFKFAVYVHDQILSLRAETGFPRRTAPLQKGHDCCPPPPSFSSLALPAVTSVSLPRGNEWSVSFRPLYVVLAGFYKHPTHTRQIVAVEWVCVCECVCDVSVNWFSMTALHGPNTSVVVLTSFPLHPPPTVFPPSLSSL